jgi:hypothetical protein
MNRTFSFLFLLFLFFFTLSCQANVIVEPAELSVALTDKFIQENTSATITILNDNNYTINVTWYLEHPSPPSLLRPNRTFIDNLSWIHITPAWQRIDSFEQASFFVSLLVPPRDTLFDQHWESWVTFIPHSEHSNGVFSQEYAVRLYIDTPVSSDQPSISDSDVSGTDFITFLFIIGGILIGSLLALLWFWKKKST